MDRAWPEVDRPDGAGPKEASNVGISPMPSPELRRRVPSRSPIAIAATRRDFGRAEAECPCQCLECGVLGGAGTGGIPPATTASLAYSFFVRLAIDECCCNGT